MLELYQISRCSISISWCLTRLTIRVDEIGSAEPCADSLSKIMGKLYLKGYNRVKVQLILSNRELRCLPSGPRKRVLLFPVLLWRLRLRIVKRRLVPVVALHWLSRYALRSLQRIQIRGKSRVRLVVSQTMSSISLRSHLNTGVSMFGVFSLSVCRIRCIKFVIFPNHEHIPQAVSPRGSS